MNDVPQAVQARSKGLDFMTSLKRETARQAQWTEVDVREFIGWLSVDIPELHRVEVPRLADSFERFKRVNERYKLATAEGDPA